MEEGRIMTDLAFNWVALAVVVVLFAGLVWLNRKVHANFSVRVIVATVAGIAVGIAFKGHMDFVGAFGTVWSNAIKAIVVPLLLFSVIASITNLGASVRLKNIGIKTVVFLLLNTLLAAVTALSLSLAFHLGEGFKWTADGSAKPHEVPSVLATLVGLFPSNLVGNWEQNQVVPVVVFALLLAIAFNEASKTVKGAKAVAPFKTFVDAGNTVLSRATQIVMGFTPYATLALIAQAVSNSVVSALLPLLGVLVVSYLALIIQLFVLQPIVLALVTRLNPIRFFKAFGPTGVVAFTSESSIGTIPVTVRQLRKSGVPEDIASFVASLGANLGMPGCAGVWPMVLAVFAINSQGLNYSIGGYALLIALALLVSIGTVGVPGTATVTATALFASAGLPVAFIAVSQPISQIVDMGRTVVNVAGAANTATIVAATEHELDRDLYYGRREFGEDDEDAYEEQDERIAAGLQGSGSASASAAAASGQSVDADVSEQDGAGKGNGAIGGESDETSDKASVASATSPTAPQNLLAFTPSDALEGTGGESCGIPSK